ncbi:hypothetical protein GQ53DRAFT_742207 [Thozetella sp. PMI_491]|nr:hypothetical protein GQ53DRAFT_742207 [Thozetella sp. PMI_491]
MDGRSSVLNSWTLIVSTTCQRKRCSSQIPRALRPEGSCRACNDEQGRAEQKPVRTASQRPLPHCPSTSARGARDPTVWLFSGHNVMGRRSLSQSSSHHLERDATLLSARPDEVLVRDYGVSKNLWCRQSPPANLAPVWRRGYC